MPHEGRRARVAVGTVTHSAGWFEPGRKPSPTFRGAAEEFLTKAKVTASKELGEGITRPLKLTLELDGKTHFAVYKNSEERKFGVQTMADGSSEIGYQDSSNGNCCLPARSDDRPRQVPATVERKVNGSTGSVQWFVESMMPESEASRRTCRHLTSKPGTGRTSR